ncbi:IS1 family transposase, partial [Escherichia coli]
SVELHDKVIGHYLNIQHYQEVGVITQGYIAAKI